MAYSEDDDLRKYVAPGDYSAFPLPLTDLHEEAARQLNVVLYSKGIDADDLARLTAATLAALREVSALNVLAMLYRRHADLGEIADRFAREYRAQLAVIPIQLTEETIPSTVDGSLLSR